MPIPDLNEYGFLPEGVHDCSEEEIENRFGRFQRSDCRCRLMERLKEYLRQAKATGLVKAVIIDGSFVTDKEEPNDVDVIVVLRPGHDFDAELSPREYNAVSKLRIRRQFKFDALVGEEGQKELVNHIEFFGRVRESQIRKGLLKVTL